jgi:dTDP-4-amino-4,6-dideoxygalactose transaminase
MRPQLAKFDEVAPFLRRVDLSNVYSNHGPLVQELEDAYSIYLKVPKERVVALSNATQAIQGLVSISSIREWIVPDYTFSATGLAVLNANQSLHICDVNLADWKIDIDLISERKRSFGIIPVMPFGSPVVFDPYKYYDHVVIDAAASLGATPPNFDEMGNNWAVVYSLHATKVLGAGEGSIVVCGNIEQAIALSAWSNFVLLSGRTSDIQGTNAKMSEITAAYGLFSILNIYVENADWLKSQASVASQTKGLRWATFVNVQPQFHPYWIASFKDEKEKLRVAERLKLAGIQTREWWATPLSMQKAFSRTKTISQSQNARYLAGVHLGLPMYRDITSPVIIEICELIETITQ